LNDKALPKRAVREERAVDDLNTTEFPLKFLPCERAAR
jgi:hypothetical protein